MFIELDGWKAKLRFSACHLIPGHQKCGKLHGHTYAVSVRMEGSQSGEFIIDFEDLKNIVRDVCDKLDHIVLVAKNDSRLKITENTQHYHIEVIKSCKHYILPREDVLLLPLSSVSAEDLCKYLLTEVVKGLNNNGFAENITSLELRVDEGIGQGAGCSMSLR